MHYCRPCYRYFLRRAHVETCPVLLQLLQVNGPKVLRSGNGQQPVQLLDWSPGMFTSFRGVGLAWMGCARVGPPPGTSLCSKGMPWSTTRFGEVRTSLRHSSWRNLLLIRREAEGSRKSDAARDMASLPTTPPAGGFHGEELLSLFSVNAQQRGRGTRTPRKWY